MNNGVDREKQENGDSRKVSSENGSDPENKNLPEGDNKSEEGGEDDLPERVGSPESDPVHEGNGELPKDETDRVISPGNVSKNYTFSI